MNLFHHFRTCVAGGSFSKLLEIYAIENKAKCNKTRSNFQDVRFYNEREKSMYAYLRLFILRSLPSCIVKQSEFREFSKYNILFKRATLTKVLLDLVKIVNSPISSEMSGTKSIFRIGISILCKRLCRSLTSKVPIDINTPNSIIIGNLY